ncbi:MAG: hypothetical protein K0V04_44485 [Deltaproteobacteria bacterium]|nr:hypothetical protein [Deltaproteobacteria bacterium]
MVGLGCSLTQRPSLKVVDPTLAAEGLPLERERADGGFDLGPYQVRDAGVRSEAPDADGPLASEDVARPVTQHRAGLVLTAPSGRSWTTSCRLQRRVSVAADYRAVLDENGDEITLDCVAKARELPPWSFTVRALLSANFAGEFVQVGSDRVETIEVLTRVVRVKRLERLLPVPVAQLRLGEDAKVAVLLGRPEKAWVAEGIDLVAAEAGLAVMLTLRFLPWELAE